MIEIIDYTLDYKSDFKDINIDWITRYFAIEPADLKMIDDPDGYILQRGGHIFMAMHEGQAVGTCALVRTTDGVYELAKMGVLPQAQGLGAGLLLGKKIIEKAQEFGCKRLFLETNHRLLPALALYQKLGFVPSPTDPDTPYQRCDVTMEIIF